MTFFQIAYKNVKGNFQNYFLYFTSMVFSIMIYFTFTSIQYNRQVLKLVSASMELDQAFKASAIAIAVFSSIFIWYSNSFFTKKRKKEIALYSILGVRKKQIARMLFYESIVMGLLALSLGILIGALFSKLFVMILIKLMGFSIPVKFAVSPRAIIETIFVFFIIFIVTAVQSYILIYRFKLIELFKAEKTGQKEPKTSLIMAALSILLIGYGYYLSHNIVKDLDLLTVLATTIIGTYILFSYVIVIVIKLSKKNKAWYFRGINMIGTSHLIFRAKGNARSLATIAVLSASTITAMGAVASVSYDQKMQINNEAPFSYVYYNMKQDKTLDRKVEDTISKFPRNRLKESATSDFLKVTGKEESASKKTPGKYYNTDFRVISESNFRELMKVRGGGEDFSFKQNECILFVSYYSENDMYSYNNKKVIIPVQGKEVKINISSFKDYNLNNRLFYNDILVVKDELYNKLYDKKSVVEVQALKVANQKESRELTERIEALIPKVTIGDGTEEGIISYYTIYYTTMTSFGALIFIGSFLSLVFLICTGSIIFFKQLAEANEDKERYRILRNIGVNKSEIRNSISKQLLIIFSLPLIVAISHSLVALFILKPSIKTNILFPISITIGTYTLIYLAYYLLAVRSYCKIINC